METAIKTPITVATLVKAPAQKVWEYWTAPQHITNWCHASADWHAPYAENDLREGGRFKTTMAAKDGSFSFDFSGVYTRVEPLQEIAYTLDDGRKVSIRFETSSEGVHVTETFEADDTHPAAMQQAGWQAILDNFRMYVEKNE